MRGTLGDKVRIKGASTDPKLQKTIEIIRKCRGMVNVRTVASI